MCIAYRGLDEEGCVRESYGRAWYHLHWGRNSTQCFTQKNSQMLFCLTFKSGHIFRWESSFSKREKQWNLAILKTDFCFDKFKQYFSSKIKSKKKLWKGSKITGQKVSVKKILNWRNIHLMQCISINIVTVLLIRNEFNFSMGKLSRILCRTANFWEFNALRVMASYLTKPVFQWQYFLEQIH